MKPSPAPLPFSRRQFLRNSSVSLLGSALAIQEGFGAQGSSEDGTLRVGLIGCGGRGTGAAAQALNADPNVKLSAMGDAFSDRLQSSLDTLQKQTEIASKIDVA